MRPLVLLNAAAGTIAESSLEEKIAGIRSAFSRQGVEVEIRAVPGDQLQETARTAAQSGVELVVAGGGDGTLKSVAGGVLGTRAVFGVLPLGTFNHFAKELEMPLELEPAVEAIVRGRAEPFSIARVNGHAFLSFAALGIYARAIRHREAQRRARQRSKPVAMLVALWRILRQPLLRRVRLEIGGQTFRRVSPSVVVACNEHQIRAMGLMDEAVLDRSKLNLCIAHATTYAGILWFVLRAMVGRLQGVFEILHPADLQIHTRHRMEQLVVDGELEEFRTPLRFELCPTPLRVMVPPPELRQEPPKLFIARK